METLNIYTGYLEMVLFTRYHKKCKVAYLRVGLLAIVLSALFLPVFKPVKSVGNNIFGLYINGNYIGKFDSELDAERLLNQARRKVAGVSADVLLIEAETEIVGEEVLVGKVDDPEIMLPKILDQYRASVKETMQHAYTLKIDDYMVNVDSAEAAIEIMEASIERYAEPGSFKVSLTADPDSALPVFIPRIEKIEEEEVSIVDAGDILGSDGIYRDFDSIFENVGESDQVKDFDDYEYGIVNVSFPDRVVVVESYLPSDQVTELSMAIDDVTKDKEARTIYEVKPGDALSTIAMKTGTDIDTLIALNENITSVNSVIRVGDNITVTVPQPELSVDREELVYYEGTYEAPIIYQYNDDWYTTTEVTLQDPSSGYHKAVQRISYHNSDVVSSEVVKEEIIAEAIPRIVEKGTKIPPTYIKPISGGHLTSPFGYRVSTFKGMTSYHKAVDWATPVGTSVVASCGGRVTQAGWMASYGYCVFITHPDGRETRYAHLSRVLVSKGDYVSQGQKIALSGNTGDSSGPHLHFELRINGVAVNPLKYIQ